MRMSVFCNLILHVYAHLHILEPGQHSQYVYSDKVMCFVMNESEFLQGQETFIFSKMPRTYLGPSQHPVQWEPRALPGVKWLGHDADN
jgi:hypothetical protein